MAGKRGRRASSMIVSVVCRGGHAEDVNDACWAPDATALLTGSIENVCMVWDVSKGKGQGRLTDHGHYVQGVAWDPAQQYVISQSADRTCRQACLDSSCIVRQVRRISVCGAGFDRQTPGTMIMQIKMICQHALYQIKALFKDGKGNRSSYIYLWLTGLQGC